MGTDVLGITDHLGTIHRGIGTLGTMIPGIWALIGVHTGTLGTMVPGIILLFTTVVIITADGMVQVGDTTLGQDTTESVQAIREVREQG